MTTTDTDREFHAQVAQRSIAAFGAALLDAQKQLPSCGPDDPTRALLEANAGVLEPQLQSCGGSFSWAAAVIWGTLNTTPTLDFAGWGSLVFAGTHWGIGAGGGISYTVGFSLVHPSEVIGDVTYTMAFSGGVVTMSFWRGPKLLLTVSGPALGIGGGTFGGSGNFRRA